MNEANTEQRQALEIGEEALDAVVGGGVSIGTGSGQTPSTRPTIGGGGGGTNTPVGDGGFEAPKPHK